MLSENRSLPRILVAGDAAVPTGFARVIEGIFKPLVTRYEIHHLGTNYRGDPHGYSWKVYPAELGGDRWGARRIVALAEKIQPHLIFIVNDIWIQSAYLHELRQSASSSQAMICGDTDFDMSATSIGKPPITKLCTLCRIGTHNQAAKDNSYRRDGKTTDNTP